ncbi:hypothetical protein CATMIT_02303 [Catenibacterium mitsuokai DSM 15897]|nr:hypothetical protein CATMIT_02303 [Catenibacterium mitsuokai DSM 15897]
MILSIVFDLPFGFRQEHPAYVTAKHKEVFKVGAYKQSSVLMTALYLAL